MGTDPTLVSRRRLLVLSGALLGAAACSPAPAPSPTAPAATAPAAKPTTAPAATQAPKPATESAKPTEAAKPVAGGSKVAPPADWQQQMVQLEAAAKREGKLQLNLQPGQVWRDWVANFNKHYPEISIEITNLQGSEFVQRVIPERQAGQFNFDVYMVGPDSAHGQLKTNGVLDPLTPALLLPEVLDDSKWLDGFTDGFTDEEGKYVYSYRGEINTLVAVNRDFVPVSALSRVEDLVDPAWKGKMSIFDPRQNGKGASDAAHWVLVKGDDWWRQLLQQQPVVTYERRQQIEWMVRGQYPIAISADTTTQVQFKREGLGLNVEPLAPDTDMGRRLSVSSVICLINRAPHPSAAKLFANWVLTKEGQELFSSITGQNSRRIDFQGPPDTAPDPKVKYAPPVNKQAYERYQSRAKEIAKEVLG